MTFVLRDGVSYRLADRLLRNAHSGDAPFALDDFYEGLLYFRIEDGTLVTDRSEVFTGKSTFSDSESYMNPMLQFGSANIPNEGLNFQLVRPDETAPANAKVKIYFTWDR